MAGYVPIQLMPPSQPRVPAFAGLERVERNLAAEFIQRPSGRDDLPPFYGNINAGWTINGVEVQNNDVQARSIFYYPGQSLGAPDSSGFGYQPNNPGNYPYTDFDPYAIPYGYGNPNPYWADNRMIAFDTTHITQPWAPFTGFLPPTDVTRNNRT